MISDLNSSKNTTLPEYDLVIVGSGPSGMTVANELRDSGIRICVLESGGLKPTKHGDGLRKVESEGIRIKEYSRERVLGGASTTWSALSSPLDEAEMKPRPSVGTGGVEGWPISRDELLPFYEAASKRYRFPPLSLFLSGGLNPVKKKGDLQLSWNEVTEKVFMSAQEPQNFGSEYKHIFESKQAPLDLYLDATLIRIQCDKSGQRADSGIIRTSAGRTFEVKARVYILATGGIENARILLNSNDLCEQGLGNGHGCVGRYFMNHPKNYYGIIRLNQPIKELPYYFGCMYQGYAGYAGLKLDQKVQKEKGVLNSYLRFEPLFPWSDNRGVEALVFLAKQCRFLMSRWKKSKQGKLVSLRDYSETGDDTELQNERKTVYAWVMLFITVFINFPQVLRYLYFRLVARSAPRIKTIRLRNFMEMEPRPENRVMLGGENDVYGRPLPVVRHECTELDKRSMIALHDVLKDELSQNSFGHMVSNLREEKSWPIDLDASHHMGTTRMGIDPRESVVNRDCRLHDVDNVYMAGGSVFPTSGCANPTYTMVALSIRLARHLESNVLGPE